MRKKLVFCSIVSSLYCYGTLENSVFSKKHLESVVTSSADPLKPFIFWHHLMPTVGLRLSPSFIPDHSFMPHFFSLWQLAPKKGAGVKIAVIDTGIALRNKTDTVYELHPDLFYQFSKTDFLNIVNSDMYTMFDHCYAFFKKKDILGTPIQWQHVIMSSLQEYCSSKTVSSCSTFLKKQQHYDANTVEDFKSMIAFYYNKHYFTPINVINTSNEASPFILEILPATTIKTEMSAHGIAICGVIAGQEHPIFGPIGLAPAAELIMVRAFDEHGCSNKITVVQALKKIQEQAIRVVNLSLKIADSWDYNDAILQEIERNIAVIPYVIAAAGNHLTPDVIKHESYPARLPSIAFDVGAYTFDGKQNYPIAPFSLYEYALGPKFVMPGFNVLSITITDNADILYGLFHGTSIATALMTGFVALLLSEFENDFTREQLLKVCYKATVRLHDTAEWQSKTVLGTIDMRCALFMLHVLRRFRELVSIKSVVTCDFNKDFEQIVCLLHAILYVNDTEVKHIHRRAMSLTSAVSYVVEKLLLQVKNLMVHPSHNLFSSISLSAQRRLAIALQSKTL